MNLDTNLFYQEFQRPISLSQKTHQTSTWASHESLQDGPFAMPSFPIKIKSNLIQFKSAKLAPPLLHNIEEIEDQFQTNLGQPSSRNSRRHKMVFLFFFVIFIPCMRCLSNKDAAPSSEETAFPKSCTQPQTISIDLLQECL